MPNWGFWEVLAISIVIAMLVGIVYATHYIATLLDKRGLLIRPQETRNRDHADD